MIEAKAVMEPVDKLMLEELPFVIIRYVYPELCALIRLSFLYFFFGFVFQTPFIITELTSQVMVVIPQIFANSVKKNITCFI